MGIQCHSKGEHIKHSIPVAGWELEQSQRTHFSLKQEPVNIWK